GPPTGRLTRPRPRGTRPRLVTDGRGRLTPPTGYCCQRLKRAPPPPGVRRLARELTKAAKVITQRIGDSRRIDCLATAQAVKCSAPENVPMYENRSSAKLHIALAVVWGLTFVLPMAAVMASWEYVVVGFCAAIVLIMALYARFGVAGRWRHAARRASRTSICNVRDGRAAWI